MRATASYVIQIPLKQFTVEKSAQLKKWKSLEQNGLIFVWFHAENAEPWELPLVDEVQTGKWKFHGYNEFLIKCHIQDIPENGADVGELNKFFSEISFGETTWQGHRTARSDAVNSDLFSFQSRRSCVNVSLTTWSLHSRSFC